MNTRHLIPAAFRRLEVGPNGTIWVQRAQRLRGPNQEEGAPDWDVFDSEGRFLGLVTMPERFVPSVFREDKIYGTWLDEMDVPYVVRFNVTDPTGT